MNPTPDDERAWKMSRAIMASETIRAQMAEADARWDSGDTTTVTASRFRQLLKEVTDS